MRLKHYDYVTLVMEDYKRKKKANRLSPLLARSTPARIRQECLNIYKERYNKKDDGLLRAFFGPEEPGRPLMQIIRNFETDKFKPLHNYLKGVTDRTEERNLDLLAWLIDFQPRPYTFDLEAPPNDHNPGVPIGQTNSPETSITIPGPGQRHSEGQEGDPGKTDTEPGKKDVDVHPEEMTEDKKRRKIKAAIATFLIAATFLGGIIWQREIGGRNLDGSGNIGCMYWTGTRYEEIPCKETRNDMLKLPMDPEKMRSFKRIMREDTITQKSIGKIHYLKINGKIEYYTTGGRHPVDVTRTLHQLTAYMYYKYLDKQDVPKKAL